MARVLSMASFSRALPSLERCERPISALSRAWGVHPGRLAQGPEEKFGFAGLIAGFASVVIAATLSDGEPLVGEGWPAAGDMAGCPRRQGFIRSRPSVGRVKLFARPDGRDLRSALCRCAPARQSYGALVRTCLRRVAPKGLTQVGRPCCSVSRKFDEGLACGKSCHNSGQGKRKAVEKHFVAHVAVAHPDDLWAGTPLQFQYDEVFVLRDDCRAGLFGKGPDRGNLGAAMLRSRTCSTAKPAAAMRGFRAAGSCVSIRNRPRE